MELTVNWDLYDGSPIDPNPHANSLLLFKYNDIIPNVPIPMLGLVLFWNILKERKRVWEREKGGGGDGRERHILKAKYRTPITSEIILNEMSLII